MLKSQLGQPVAGEYPETLVEAYPELRAVLANRKGPAPQGQPGLEWERADATSSEPEPQPVSARPLPASGPQR